MTAYDVRARATAARLLAPISQGGKAQAITLTHTAPRAYDTAAGTTTPVVTTQTGSGVVFEYNTFIRSGIRNEPGSMVQAGDKQLLLSPLKADGTALTAPQVNDTASVAGVVYTITAVAPLSPAGTPIYFECNIRGAP